MSTKPDAKIELVEESLAVGRRAVSTGKVRVRTETESFDSLETLTFDKSSVEVRRVPIGREIDAVPPPRQEGNTIILSVVDEILVVEKRLVLREEIHLHRGIDQTTIDVPAQLRRQRAIVERFDGEGQLVATEIITPSHDAAPITPEETPMTSTDASLTADNGLSAFFDTKADAEQALESLRAAGIPEANLRLTEGAQANDGTTDANGEIRQKGFFEALGDFFFPEEDRYAYAEGLSRGGYLLTVMNLPEHLREQALDILDSSGAVNIDDREESWRAEGWSPASWADDRDSRQTGTTGLTGADPILTPEQALTGASGLTDRETASMDRDIASDRSIEGQSSATDITDGSTETIPVIEEQLRVGKRDTSHGRVRVRSYVREQPASAEVELRSERVELERRPVDRPVTDADTAFRDQVIEAEEYREEAVVSKEARVVEEIELRKQQETRTEQVTDTVRRTEVEVEDERREVEDATGRR